MGNLLETIIRESYEFVESERKSTHEAKALAHTMATTEITRLREQNALLTCLLESEKEKTDQAKNELLKQVSGLLGSFATTRDKSLRTAVDDIKGRNAMAETDISRFDSKHGDVSDNMIGRGVELGKGLERRGAEGKRTRDGAFKVIHPTCSLFNVKLIFLCSRPWQHLDRLSTKDFQPCKAL
jgi:kinesin family member 11